MTGTPRCRFIALALAFALPLAAACSSSNNNSANNKPASTTASTQTAVGSAAAPAGSPAASLAGKTIKIGAIHVGSINDNGYNQAMHEGLLALKKNIPGVEIIEQENVPETPDVERVMENMISQGAKIIFPMSFGYLDSALNVAAKHPDVKFEHPAGFKQSANLGTFWSDTTDLEYLMGMVAAKSSKTGKFGWVIGFPIPNILTAVNAFELGAKSVNPSATTRVIVDNTWVDPQKEAGAVNALADSGVDVVTMLVDSPATVVQTADKRGIMSIGFHCLCVQSAAGKSWLTGVGFVWGDLFTKFVTDVLNGTWKSENNVGSLDKGYAQIAPYGPTVSADTKALVDQKKADIIAGKLKVFTGPIMDNTGKVQVPAGQVGDEIALLNSDDWLVQGATGNLK
ncbi:MAG: BMP family ABC transporter substrate-binding protein [Dehalococcoidia bacterium]